jgi:hypothetical protein
MGKKQSELKGFWSIEDSNKLIVTFGDLTIEKVAFSLLLYSGKRSAEMLALNA